MTWVGQTSWNFLIAAVLYPSPTTVLIMIIPGLEEDDLKFHEGFLLVQAFQFCCSLNRLNPLAETLWCYFMTNGDSLQRIGLLSAGSIFHPAKAGETDQIKHISRLHLGFTHHLTQTSRTDRCSFFQCSTCTRRLVEDRLERLMTAAKAKTGLFFLESQWNLLKAPEHPLLGWFFLGESCFPPLPRKSHHTMLKRCLVSPVHCISPAEFQGKFTKSDVGVAGVHSAICFLIRFQDVSSIED